MTGAPAQAAGLPAAGFAVRRGLITFFVMAATTMQVVDSTIANVALPQMQGTMLASQDEITWVLTSYIVAAAIATPLTGWMAARFGRRRTHLASIAGFTIASAMCGMADSLPQIVVFRLLQGVCGAALVPLAQSIILDLNPPARHGRAMAIFGMGAIGGSILGPTLGGWLTDALNWRWVFFINLPFGVISFLGLAAFSPPDRELRRAGFDFFGFVSLSLGVGALQMVLDRGEIKDWLASPEIRIEALVAVVGFWLFVVHTVTTDKRSFLDKGLATNRNFAICSICVFFLGSLNNSVLSLTPTMMQYILNYPALTAGMATAPRGIGTMFGMMFVSFLIGRVDPRLLIGCGLASCLLSLWQMTRFSLQMDTFTIVVAGLGLGFGTGTMFVPLSTLAFTTLSRALRTDGTAFYSLVRQSGASISISIVQAQLLRNTQIVHAGLAEHLRPGNPMAQPPYLPESLLTATGSQLALLDQEVTRQAAMVAYIDDYRFLTIVALVSAPLILLLRPRHAEARDAREVSP